MIDMSGSVHCKSVFKNDKILKSHMLGGRGKLVDLLSNYCSCQKMKKLLFLVSKMTKSQSPICLIRGGGLLIYLQTSVPEFKNDKIPKSHMSYPSENISVNRRVHISICLA